MSEPSSGSHWWASYGSGGYSIPAHNGLKTEIPDVYIRGLCRAFAIDFREFMREL